MLKRAGGVLLAASVLFTCAGTALGSGNQSETFPITFDLSGATCDQLAGHPAIHGTGVATFSLTPSGVFHSVIDGTATDGSGGSWVFTYTDNARPVGTDGSVQITDHFNLVGDGGNMKLHSHFTIIFAADGTPTDIKQVTGDPVGCDPI